MKTNWVLVGFVILYLLQLQLQQVSADADQDICPELHKEWEEYQVLHEKEGKDYVELSQDEYQEQPPFYEGKSVNEIIGLCRLENGTYDFGPSNPYCTANNVTLKDNERREKLLRERRVQLCDAISKVISFKARLESPAETVIQFILFSIALICGLYLILVGHFRLKTMIDERFPDPTKGWPFWVYQKMNYYVVPVGKEVKKPDNAKVAEKLAQSNAKERELEIDDVIDSDDEKEDVFQTAAAVTDYSDFWTLFQAKNSKDKKSSLNKSVK